MASPRATARALSAAAALALLVAVASADSVALRSGAAPNASLVAPLASVARRVDEVKPNAVPPPWLDRNNVCRPLRAARGADPTAAICDPSSLLSEREIGELSAPLETMYAGRDPYALVRCPDGPDARDGPVREDATGFRVAVLVVRRMPYDARALSARAEAFAHAVFQRWGLSGNCGASVLLFVSVDDRRMYMQTGRLATNYLNTHQIDEVFSRITPHMRKQRLYAALSAAVDRVGFYLAHYHGFHPGARHSHGHHHNDPLFLRNGPRWWDLEMSIVALVLVAFVACACCNGLGGPAAAERKRERREAEARAAQAVPYGAAGYGTDGVHGYGGDGMGPPRYGYDDRNSGGGGGGGGGGLLGTMGGLLAAGGVGALIGSAFSGHNNNSNNNNNNDGDDGEQQQRNGHDGGYSDIGAGADAGPLPSWYVGAAGEGAGSGQGASWANDAVDESVAPPAWATGGSGQGAGWEVDGEGGAGAGWGGDDGGGDDDNGGGDDGDGAGF